MEAKLTSSLKLGLLNARFLKNKSSLIHDSVVDEVIDLACILESRVTGKADVKT